MHRAGSGPIWRTRSSTRGWIWRRSTAVLLDEFPRLALVRCVAHHRRQELDEARTLFQATKPKLDDLARRRDADVSALVLDRLFTEDTLTGAHSQSATIDALAIELEQNRERTIKQRTLRGLIELRGSWGDRARAGCCTRCVGRSVFGPNSTSGRSGGWAAPSARPPGSPRRRCMLRLLRRPATPRRLLLATPCPRRRCGEAATPAPAPRRGKSPHRRRPAAAA